MASKSVQIKEKKIPATISSVEEPIETNEAAEVIPERNLKRAIWTIVYGVALPCIPIIIICSVLLYIIFHNRLELNSGLAVLQVQPDTTASQLNATKHGLDKAASELGRIRREGGGPAYYLRYNATTITTIASWTSRIIPYLQSSIMALVAFFAARYIVQKSRHGDESQLLNPEQLALLIGTLGGNGFGPLKDVLMYRYAKNGKLTNPLPAAASALTIITTMAFIIPAIDTWFGVATTTQTVTQINVVANPTLTYGKSISSGPFYTCPASSLSDNEPTNPYLANETAFWPCNVQIASNDRIVYGIEEASNIATGTSKYNKVHNITDTAGNNIWYLGSPAQNSVQDYQATTFATTSQCQPMKLEQCGLVSYEDGSLPERFQCNENFVGSLLSKQLNTSASGVLNATVPSYPVNVGLAFSGDAALTEVTGHIWTKPRGNVTAGRWDPEMYRTNPLYYGAWALGFPGPDLVGWGEGDSSFYWNYALGGAWILNCSTTVYELTYSWVNGSVASFNHSLASDDMAALLTGPFVVGSNVYIDNALYTAAIAAGATNDSLGIANTFATEYSKLLLAYSISALEAQVVSAEQNRTNISNVARIPLIPLYLLLMTKVIYILAVIILAIAAYAFTHPAETEIVKDQLTIKGLTSAHFDRPDVMQEYAVKQLQSHFENTTHAESPNASSSSCIDGPSRPLLKHAATGPTDTSVRPTEPKIGLILAVDGTWQWIVKADGVWNSVKPLVKSIAKDVVLQETNAGSLGSAGEIVRSYKGA